jgi:hypothetical protein
MFFGSCCFDCHARRQPALKLNQGGIVSVSASRYRIPSPPADPGRTQPYPNGAYKNPHHEPRNGESRGNGPRRPRRPGPTKRRNDRNKNENMCTFRVRLIDPTRAAQSTNIKIRRRVSRVTTHRAAPRARTRTAARRTRRVIARRGLELNPHSDCQSKTSSDAHTCYSGQLCT